MLDLNPAEIPVPTFFHPGSPDPTFFHPGSDFYPSRIPDPGSELSPSRIRIEEFKYFNPKKWFLSSRKYDPGCSSRIPDPDAYFLPIPDPRSRGKKGTGSRIRNTVPIRFHLKGLMEKATAMSAPKMATMGRE
jgi:hypothetical protein